MKAKEMAKGILMLKDTDKFAKGLKLVGHSWGVMFAGTVVFTAGLIMNTIGDTLKLKSWDHAYEINDEAWNELEDAAQKAIEKKESQED